MHANTVNTCHQDVWSGVQKSHLYKETRKCFIFLPQLLLVFFFFTLSLASPLIWITGVPLWPSSSTFTNDHDALTNSVVVSIGGQIIWSVLEVPNKCPMSLLSLKDLFVFSVANRCFLSIFFPSLRAHYHVILIHNINMRSDSKSVIVKCSRDALVFITCGAWMLAQIR